VKSRITSERLQDLQSITDAALAYLPLEGLLDELLTRVIGIIGGLPEFVRSAVPTSII